MSYEDAPGTALLAVHCAVCARPLLDSVSVEAGIGPDCRARYGYDEAQSPPDFDRACRVLEDQLARGEFADLDEDFPPPQRRLANLLVHRIAVGQRGPDVGAYVAALAALGFERLARRIAERIGAVEVTRDGETLLVRTTRRLDDEDFEVFTAATRALGRWDRERKARIVPVGERSRLWAMLRVGLRPGTIVLGERLAVI